MFDTRPVLAYIGAAQMGNTEWGRKLLNMDSPGKLYAFLALLLLLPTLAFGVWLHFAGKPYGNALFTLHKLAGLATAVLSALFVFRALRSVPPTGAIVILLIAAALAVLALFASGAWMSAGSGPLSLPKVMHIIATVVFILACGGAVFQLLGRLR